MDNYTVVYSRGTYYYEVIENVKVSVNIKIKEGYTPLGGISISIDKNGYYTVAQAMELRR